MKKFLYIISLFPIVPTIALAQTLSAQSFISKFLVFANTTLIQALIGITFLIFIINVIRFFVINGENEDGRKNAKNLAVYSVLAFVILIIFWGMVNLLAGSLPFSGQPAPTPDYVEKWGETIKTTPKENQAPCGELEKDFDNVFGGPCATDNRTVDLGNPNLPADQVNPSDNPTYPSDDPIGDIIEKRLPDEPEVTCTMNPLTGTCDYQ